MNTREAMNGKDKPSQWRTIGILPDNLYRWREYKLKLSRWTAPFRVNSDIAMSALLDCWDEHGDKKYLERNR